MAEKYKNRYRTASHRARWWDYNKNGVYFVTIRTSGQDRCFGIIDNDQVILSKTGQIASETWTLIPEYFTNVKLDTFIVMPDHFHGIIMISKTRTKHVSITDTGHDETFRPSKGGFSGHNNPMLYNNLARIIRWYKARVTYFARKEQALFAWQPRYYDTIIRDPESLDRIRQYINNNPSRYHDRP